MFVSDKHKIAFCHIPKTGGSTIRQMMLSVDPRCYKYKRHHLPMCQEDADHFKDYFKFTVVRNSYKMCASLYRNLTQTIGSSQERKKHAKFIKPNGLLEFLKAYNNVKDGSKKETNRALLKDPNKETLDYALRYDCYPIQMDYFTQEGKTLVDKVFMYDRGLDDELLDLKKQIGFNRKLMYDEHLHSNYHGEYDWKSYYNTETIEYVYQACQKDIEHFGFKFDED